MRLLYPLPDRPRAPSDAAGDDLIRTAILTARMRRDRARLVEAKAEIEALRDRVKALESHPALRAYERSRRAYSALPLGLRTMVRGILGGAPVPATPVPATPLPVPMDAPAGPPPRGRALIVDDHWPQPDRDAGSVEIVNLVHALAGLGFAVVVAADQEHGAPSAARDALLRDGVRCLSPADAPSVEAYIASEATRLDVIVLCRAFCGGRFLEAARRDAPGARIIFDAIDLAFLREERRARLTGDEEALAAALRARERETAIIRESDATLVVSRAELDLLATEMPEALVAELPLARPVTPPATGFAERRGIGFIGGFAHAPNLDAVRHFLDEVWPLLQRDLPDLEMTIVGADPPDGLLDGVPGRVRALGQLPDVAPWFEGLRLTVAPLRYGAGAKGKVASSLAAGVPCVATPIAAEGMSLSADSGVLVADDPAAFAARVREAYGNEALWNRLSAGALAHARSHLSPESWRGRLDALLRRVGL